MLAIAQRIVDGPHRHAAAAREACRRGAWADLARRTAPEPPGFFGRGDWRACVELASHTFAGPKPVTLTIVPAWGCSTYEEPSTDWVEIHGVFEDAPQARGEPYIAERSPWDEPSPVDPRLSSTVVTRANAYEVAWVVPSESYAPSIELMLRRGRYGVLAARVLDLVSILEGGYRDAANVSELAPRPSIEVPPFCQCG